MTTSKRAAGRPSSSSSAAGSQKTFGSDAISEHLAAFLRNGGRIEKLGTPRVLQKIDGGADAKRRR